MDALRATGLANSSQRQTPRAAAPKNEPPKVCCDICGVNLHTTAECPLMQQILGSNVKLTAKAILSSAHQLQCQATLGQPSCGLEAFQKVPIKGDGNCFFAAAAVCMAVASNPTKPVPDKDAQHQLGQQLRLSQLAWMKDQVANDCRFPDESGALLSDAILAATGMEASQYFAQMEACLKNSEHAWGGVLEASVIAKRTDHTMYICQEHAESYVLLCLAGQGSPSCQSIFLVWNGDHYDALIPANRAGNPFK